jgi:hypothetical protein
MGIAFICLGMIGFTICGIVLLRLPIPGVPLQHWGSFAFHIMHFTFILWTHPYRLYCC